MVTSSVNCITPPSIETTRVTLDPMVGWNLKRHNTRRWSSEMIIFSTWKNGREWQIWRPSYPNQSWPWPSISKAEEYGKSLLFTFPYKTCINIVEAYHFFDFSFVIMQPRWNINYSTFLKTIGYIHAFDCWRGYLLLRAIVVYTIGFHSHFLLFKY